MSPLDWLERALRAFRARNGPAEACYRGVEAPGTRGCHEDCDSVVLTDLHRGSRGTVTCLEDPGSAEAQRLTAMGILPGAPLELLQTYPVHVFRVGHAEFAVDGELASLIRIRAAPNAARPSPSTGLYPASSLPPAPSTTSGRRTSRM